MEAIFLLPDRQRCPGLQVLHQERMGQRACGHLSLKSVETSSENGTTLWIWKPIPQFLSHAGVDELLMAVHIIESHYTAATPAKTDTF